MSHYLKLWLVCVDIFSIFILQFTNIGVSGFLAIALSKYNKVDEVISKHFDVPLPEDILNSFADK
ncbi:MULTISPECIES: hypothetical protein [Nostocales]|uniref:Uncharacterized protein n=1 Tax=Dolichospermum flos-aquae UHCC 0037 TaxID=2590026 RepID=A0ACC7SAU1_DOLFA|nr:MULTISPECIES: hypothetical protein [Nostocales]MBO1065060.1 hypothetical protein [Anabaena sp. 54]MTJ45663.1 hypothetical protein [Dolichospermum flos-aquae UHCC 0037]QSV73689.1 MAG: hypothetical protein HEQ20_26570 [Aphanizomenon flos-aquae KM1D3_PB]